MQPIITLTRCWCDVRLAENQYWVNVSMLGLQMISSDDRSVTANVIPMLDQLQK